MAWRPHSRARVNPKHPEAWGVCDRCGDLLNIETNMFWQHEWRGNILMNIWLRVCRRCTDVPQDQLRPKALPPDPTPIFMPRVFNYAAADAGGPQPSGPQPVPNFITSDVGEILSDQNNNLLVSET